MAKLAKTQKNNKKKKLTLLQKRMLMGYVFILPWFIGFLYFYVRSMVRTFQFSFSEVSMDAASGGLALDFTGLENYLYAFRVHGTFKQVLTSSLISVVVDVPLIIFFSLFVAMLLNKKFPGRPIIRIIFFLPIIMASEAISDAMALSMQMMAGGVSSTTAALTAETSTASVNVDYFLDIFLDLGLPRQIVEYLVLAVARINAIVEASGVQIIIFLAALQSIPGSLYEVADIEGATGYETFWKITFPMVMPHIITNIVYTIVDSFTRSAVVTLAYNTAFDEFRYGLSSAFSLISTLITLAILLFVVWLIQRRTFYYN
jgi:ABC-type sugar transport system permease subunit